MAKEKKINDLILLPEVRTVVQLSDLSDPSLREGIKAGFVLTEDVLANLSILLDRIICGSGMGIFLEGSYGSGKSHFLSIVSLLLSQPDTWGYFLMQEKGLTDYYMRIKEKRLLPVAISLVSHASREPLEGILYTYLNQVFAPPEGDRGNWASFDPSVSRPENFARLSALLKKSAFDGVVIIIDELSEFLRSKSDGRSFNEDIRFLQFLGEYSQKNPLWVIASLQERLEEIGAINEESFNKIKDRYPIRLMLSAEHIEALIKKRLIVKREGAAEEINSLYTSFKKAFPRMDITQDAFYDLYPVHPATISLLDELKFLFSQKRGIVDFIHYQIKGDSARKIPGIMENPADSLLGPEYIFDHFLVRLRETTQTRAYYQTVYGYYDKELDALFPDEESRAVARRLVKILLLKAFSPHKKGLTVRETGEMLLCAISCLDSSVNYRFLADIMERLLQQGAYIVCRKGKDFYEDSYSIDLKEDIQGIIRQKGDYIRQGLLPDDERIFNCLSEWVDDPALPLARLKRKAETKGFVKWQYTAREGAVCVRPIDGIGTDELRGLYADFRRGEDDFFLFMHPLSPAQGYEFYQNVLSGLKDLGENLPFIIWIPKYPPDDKELRDGAVYYLLLEKYKNDFTDTGRRIYEHLSLSLQERKERIAGIFRDAYYDGEILYLNREGIKKAAEIGILPFDKTLQRIVAPCLNHLFPLHKDISPLSDYFVRETLVKTIEGFFRQGEITFEAGMDKGIELLIEGYLKPLKVLKQIPSGYRLNCDPGTSAIVSAFLARLSGGRARIEEIYLGLRKGEYGISKNQFEMLTLALLFSGQVRGFASGREVGIQRPDFTGIWCMEEIGEGKLIDPLMRDFLLRCPLIPQKIKKSGFSFVMQQRAWESLIEAKRAWTADEEGFRQVLRYTAKYKSCAHIDLMQIEEAFSTVKALYGEIKTTYPAKEGLECLLAQYRDTPFADEALDRVERFRLFASHDLEIYANIYAYMTDQALGIPALDQYSTALGLYEEAKRLLNYKEIYEKGYIDGLVKVFNQFKEAYTLIYQQEHQRVKSPDSFAPYLRIRDGQRYQILARISRISMISVEDDIVKVNRYLADVGGMICKGLDIEQLRRRPVCGCGFRLGETAHPIPIKQIEEAIDRGLCQYLDALKEPRYREQVIAYAVGLEDVGKGKEAERLRQFIDFSLAKEDDIRQLDKMLTDTLINGLNEAFEGKSRIIERDINDLLENIIDRNFPKEKLIAIFTEWLNRGAEIDNDVYIKIKYKAQGQHNHLIAETAGRMFPELISLIKGIGEERFQHLLIASMWAASHKLPMEGIFQAFSITPPPDIDTEGFDEKCRRIFASLVKQRGDNIYNDLDATEQFIITQRISPKLLDMLKQGATEEGLLDGLFHESLFSFSSKGITSLLIKRLFSEREQRTVSRINSMIRHWRENGGRPIEATDIPLERVEQKRCLSLIENACLVVRALDWLEGAQLSGYDAAMWERAFMEHGACFEIAGEILKKGIQNLGMTDALSLKALNREKGRFIASFQEGFSAFIAREYNNMLSSARSGTGTLFINSLRYGIYERYRKRLTPAKTHFLLIDGMRWDIWAYCEEEILTALGETWRIAEKAPLWVFLPSTTLPQLDPFITGDPPPDAHITERDSAASLLMEERQYYAGDARAESRGGFLEIIPEKENTTAYKYSFIDTKIHTSQEGLVTIYDEIRLNLVSALKGHMDTLPAKGMVILFSDHGFVKKRESARPSLKTGIYSHGWTSPWEMIVPLIVLYKWR